MGQGHTQAGARAHKHTHTHRHIKMTHVQTGTWFRSGRCSQLRMGALARCQKQKKKSRKSAPGASVYHTRVGTLHIRVSSRGESRS
jgi:hypothetical protein